MQAAGLCALCYALCAGPDGESHPHSGWEARLLYALVTLLQSATACETLPLTLRTVQPPAGATDVPLDVRIALSFLGFGTAEEYEVGLYQGGVAVPVEASSDCYEHEGPEELHCWWYLRPKSPLLASTEYELRASTTALWSGTGARLETTSFTTGTAEAAPVEGVPTVTILEAWDELGDASCEYASSRRYWIEIKPAGGLVDPSHLSLYHVDALGRDGQVKDRVHTVLVNNPGSEAHDALFKQFLDTATDPSDCFRVVQEGPDGSTTEAVDACYKAPEDTGADTGGDTGADSGTDSGVPDTGAPDSQAQDSTPADTGEPDPGADPPGGCGCSASGAPGAGAVLLVLGLTWLRRAWSPRVSPRRSDAPPVLG